MAEQEERKPRRRGYRQFQIRAVDRGPLDPRYLAAVGDDPQPGEVESLRYERGRGPITDDEALAVLRKNTARSLARKYREADLAALRKAGAPETYEDALRALLPQELPAWDTNKELKSYKLATRLMAKIAALAEVQDVSETTLIELLLWRASKEPPKEPAALDAEYAQMMSETVMLDRMIKKARTR